MDYAEFANKSIEEFKEIQNKFLEDFRINDYDNWYYDQATELLTFSTESEEINFKYIPIGTYSEKTETWMWSWNKSDIEGAIKDKALQIRDFGLMKNYKKLIQGHFESDIYDGWEFIAISKNVLGGIGGYRVKSDHLEIYMLVKEQVENEIANNIKRQVVNCEIHGANRVAFVCQHLIDSKDQGFEEAFLTTKGMKLGEEDDFQAWCDKCEIERLRTDGWNDESMKFAQIKLICEDCYFEIKERNLRKND